MRAPSFCRAAALALLLGVWPSRGEAQSAADKAAAEALFDQGRAAMQESDFAKACGLLERSQHIDPAVGTLLYLAECYEKSGRTASAWATFREAADAADAAREPDRARTGRKRAERLEPGLSRLTIQVAPENQELGGLSIERRGQPVKPALWNVPVPVDPGEYSIAASAPGYEAWSQSIAVPERAARVSVAVPPLKKKPAAEALPSLAPAASQPSAQPAVPPMAGTSFAPSAELPTSPPASGSARRTAAYLLGGVGVVSIGVGSFFGVRAIMKSKEAKDHCPRGYECDDQQGETAATDAKHAARISDLTIGVGALAVIGGAVLYVSAPATGTASTPRFRASVGPSGITLGGSFQ